ncbi:hypothetical protein ACGFXB_00940, partial [Streptomyces canus]
SGGGFWGVGCGGWDRGWAAEGAFGGGGVGESGGGFWGVGCGGWDRGWAAEGAFGGGGVGESDRAGGDGGDFRRLADGRDPAHP